VASAGAKGFEVFNINGIKGCIEIHFRLFMVKTHFELQQETNLVIKSDEYPFKAA
jgi:hypothetical protein